MSDNLLFSGRCPGADPGIFRSICRKNHGVFNVPSHSECMLKADRMSTERQIDMKHKKKPAGKPAVLLSILCAICMLCSCAATNAAQTSATTGASTVSESESSTQSTSNSGQTSSALSADSELKSSDTDASWSEQDACIITLNNTSATVSSAGAAVSGGKITVTKAGTYIVRGSLGDGQIIVSAGSGDSVRLVFDGVSLTCSGSAALEVLSCDKLILTLAEGTANTLTDSGTYGDSQTGEDGPDAALFSKSDLTINGSGTLSVKGLYQNAINCKDSLKLIGCTLTAEAENDAIKGKDCIVAKGALIKATSGSDALESSGSTKSGSGFIILDQCRITVSAGGDGIQATGTASLTGTDLTAVTGGGSANSINAGSNQFGGGYTTSTQTDSVSAKAVKAQGELVINGGTFSIDSADDAIHSDTAVVIESGTIAIASGDDGIHADDSLTVKNGVINIKQCYEGLESMKLTIAGGTIDITADDDGLNAAGGNDSSSLGGRPGQNSFSSSSDQYLKISGGCINIDADGDGIDINGSVTMSAGTLTVNGPLSDGNGALDYDTGFQMTGGTIAAAGSAGMAMAPDTTSSIYSVLINFDSALAVGTTVRIADESGKTVIAFTPDKRFQSLAVSCAALKNGQTYTVYTGGTVSGANAQGLSLGGTASGGTKAETFTVESVVTTLGNSGMNPGGGPGSWHP